MKVQCHHIPIDEATDLLKEQFKNIGFKDIVMEEDDVDYKNFFAKSDQLFENAFFCVEMVLFALFYEDKSGAGMEFHAYFFTRKGQKLQRDLSRNDFENLRMFLDEQIFEPSGLKAVEYDPSGPADRDYRHAKNAPNLFSGHTPGVELHVGGWLCKK